MPTKEAAPALPVRPSNARSRKQKATDVHFHMSSEPTLYLFDGYNLFHAGSFEDPRELVDRLASFVALHGARGVIVFDGVGEERTPSTAGARPSASSPPTARSAVPPARRFRSAARPPSLVTSRSPGTRRRNDRSFVIAWTKRRENV